MECLDKIFRGRLDLKNYIIGQIFGIFLIAIFISLAKPLNKMFAWCPYLGIIVYVLIGLSIALYFGVLDVRRLHDLGISGWSWMTGTLILGYFRKGKDVPNNYGYPLPRNINFLKAIFKIYPENKF